MPDGGPNQAVGETVTTVKSNTTAIALLLLAGSIFFSGVSYAAVRFMLPVPMETVQTPQPFETYETGNRSGVIALSDFKVKGDATVGKSLTVQDGLSVNGQTVLSEMSASSVDVIGDATVSGTLTAGDLVVGDQRLSEVIELLQDSASQNSTTYNASDCTDCVKLSHTSASTALIGNVNVSGKIQSGQAAVRPGQDISDAFVIETATGERVLRADTLNKKIIVRDLLPATSGSYTDGSYTPAYIQDNLQRKLLSEVVGGYGTIMKKEPNGYAATVVIDDTAAGLYYVRCLDDDCSQKTETAISHPGTYLEYPELEFGTDGLARIAVHDYNNGLLFIRCTNLDCSSSQSNYVDSQYGDEGNGGIGMALTSGGLPRLSYLTYDSVNSEIITRFAVCQDLDCAAATVQDLDTNYWYYEISDVKLGSDGLARIVYMNEDGVTKFVRCTDTNCTAPVTTVIDDDLDNLNLDLGCQENELIFGSDGFARLLFTSCEPSGNVLYYVTCSDEDCASYTRNRLGDVGQVSQGGEIILDGNDVPSVLYTNADGELTLYRCLNSLCSQLVTSTLESADRYSGETGVSAYRGADGYLRVIYETYDDNTADYNLTFSEFTDLDASTPVAAVTINPVVTQGTAIGSTSSRFGQMFVQEIDIQSATTGSALTVNQIGASSGSGKIASFQVNGIEKVSIESDGALNAASMILNGSSVPGNLLQATNQQGNNLLSILNDGTLTSGDDVSVSEGEVPASIISTISYGSGSLMAAGISGDHMYTVGSQTNQIQVYNIKENPTSPTLIGSANTFSKNAAFQDIEIRGTYAYVSRSSPSSAFEVYDIYDPKRPYLVSSVTPSPSNKSLNEIKLQGNYAYVSGDSHLNIFDITNPLKPSLVSSLALGSTEWNNKNVYVDGSTAYVLKDSPLELMTVDITNPAAPVLLDTLDYINEVGSYSGPYGDRAIYKNGDYLYFGTQCFGSCVFAEIQVIDVSNANNISLVSKAPVPDEIGNAYSFWWDDTGLYLHSRTGISKVNLDNPTSPVTESYQNVYTDSPVLGFLISANGYFYSATWSGIGKGALNTITNNLVTANLQDLSAMKLTVLGSSDFKGELAVSGLLSASSGIKTGNLSISTSGLITNSSYTSGGIQLASSSINYWKDPALTAPLKGVGSGTVVPVTGQTKSKTTRAALVTPASDTTSLRLESITASNSMEDNYQTISFTAWTASGTAQIEGKYAQSFDNWATEYVSVTFPYTDGVVTTTAKRYTARFTNWWYVNRFDINVLGGATGVYIADIQVEAGSNPTSFFYGDSGIGYKWQGTVNNSFSEKVAGFYSDVSTTIIQNNLSTNQQVIRQKSGAATDLVQLQDSGGSVTARFDAGGRLSIGTTRLGAAQASFGTLAAANQGLIIQGVASQTGDLMQARDSTGAVLSRFDAGGRLGIATARIANAQMSISTLAAANQGLIVQGVASQTADLLQARNSTGTVLASISSAGNLSVQAATITGTLTVNGKIITSGTAPTIAAAAGAGASATATVTGNDTAGRITITTGATGMAAGTLATLTYNGAYASAPRITLTPVGNTSAAIQYNIGASNTSNFTVNSNSAPAASTTYTYFYHVMQ